MDDPIMPSLELIQRLREKAPHGISDARVTRELCLIADAYIAGADQELEACCEWLDFYSATSTARGLRAARRPKPQSLKEQALEALGYLQENEPNYQSSFDTIQRALEQLND